MYVCFRIVRRTSGTDEVIKLLISPRAICYPNTKDTIHISIFQPTYLVNVVNYYLIDDVMTMEKNGTIVGRVVGG